MTKKIVKLKINSLNLSPQGNKHIIVSLGSIEDDPMLIGFELDTKLLNPVGGWSPKAIKEMATQLGMEVTEAHFELDDHMNKRVLKRQQRRNT